MSGDALHRFIDTVEGHYKSPNPEPLLLSRFGQQHKELLAELKAEFISLKAAVRAAGEDRSRFIDTTVGREAIAPVAIAAELQLQIQEDSASRQQAANYFESLPTPVQIAFCVRTDAGEHVAIDTVRRFVLLKSQRRTWSGRRSVSSRMSIVGPVFHCAPRPCKIGKRFGAFSLPGLAKPMSIRGFSGKVRRLLRSAGCLRRSRPTLFPGL
ncbi:MULTISPECIES: hypothetical protein [unclassified Mesorhizobium]|uniref:hypothetical protein n=1 Tax=unclassified Mesorhizobium TaxID=325217 RepID=UPI00333A6DB7